jgi:hypothetical protein
MALQKMIVKIERSSMGLVGHGSGQAAPFRGVVVDIGMYK